MRLRKPVRAHGESDMPQARRHGSGRHRRGARIAALHASLALAKANNRQLRGEFVHCYIYILEHLEGVKVSQSFGSYDGPMLP